MREGVGEPKPSNSRVRRTVIGSDYREQERSSGLKHKDGGFKHLRKEPDFSLLVKRRK